MITLDQLAIEHGTDKSSLHHNYCGIYDKYFSSLRDKDFLFVEAGVGGYDQLNSGGQSARMWRDYFTQAKVVTFDIHSKSPHLFNGVSFMKGSQDDAYFLESLVRVHGHPLVFIDDASHINDLTIATFEIMFPMLLSGGIYVVEDIETSYYCRDGFGGVENPIDFNANTSMNYFRKALNDLNSQYISNYIPEPENIHRDIESIHFYKNLIIILKK
jgi:hypothetical protein